MSRNGQPEPPAPQQEGLFLTNLVNSMLHERHEYELLQYEDAIDDIEWTPHDYAKLKLLLTKLEGEVDNETAYIYRQLIVQLIRANGPHIIGDLLATKITRLLKRLNMRAFQ